MTTYRAALIGCGRIGAFIDNEVADPHPYSHAAAYEACERTTLVALADRRADVMARAGARYGVPHACQYTDYREMLAAERPDIVSVATQPEHRAEIVIHAAEHGARAIYAEKAMAASLAEADAMVRAVEDHGVAFNMGTNRRWHPGFRLLRSLIAEGRYGALRSLTVHCGFGVFNMGSHAIDLVLMLNGDTPASWVQFHVSEDADRIEGATLRADPSGGGRLQFANGVPAFLLDSGRPFELEAVCERGIVSTVGSEWQVREEAGADLRGRPVLGPGTYPAFEPGSPAVHLVLDLVQALDTGAPTRGGVRVARTNTELIFACLESHRNGGARTALPLAGSELRLQREVTPRQPLYQPRSRAV